MFIGTEGIHGRNDDVLADKIWESIRANALVRRDRHLSDPVLLREDLVYAKANGDCLLQDEFWTCCESIESIAQLLELSDDCIVLFLYHRDEQSAAVADYTEFGMRIIAKRRVVAASFGNNRDYVPLDVRFYTDGNGDFCTTDAGERIKLSEDGMVGTAHLAVTDGIGYISDLEVIASHRRRGIGRGLMELCLSEAEKSGSSFAYAISTPLGYAAYRQIPSIQVVSWVSIFI